MVPVESKVVRIFYWRKRAGKLGEDGKMFETELAEGQTIINDIIQGLTLEEDGWGKVENVTIGREDLREFKDHLYWYWKHQELSYFNFVATLCPSF